MCEDKTETIARFRVVAMWQVSKRSPLQFQRQRQRQIQRQRQRQCGKFQSFKEEPGAISGLLEAMSFCLQFSTLLGVIFAQLVHSQGQEKFPCLC